MMKLFPFFFFLILSQTLSAQGKFFGGNGDGFATATMANLVLPVNILNFTVYKNGRGNKAELTIVYNEAVCSVQLQRSIDRNNFSVIDSIQPANPTGSSKHFVFTDPAPASGINYYRMRINRCDASFLYSAIVSINAGKIENVLYYSAVDNAIHYAITESGLLKIVNGSGQIIHNKTLQAGSGVFSLPVMNNGIYFMQFAREAPVKIFVQQ